MGRGWGRFAGGLWWSAFAGEAFFAFEFGFFERGQLAFVHFSPDFVAVDGDGTGSLDREADAGARPFDDLHFNVAINDNALTFAAAQCQHNESFILKPTPRRPGDHAGP